MKGFILLALCYFLLNFAINNAQAGLGSMEQEARIRECSETLPVDLYMKCLERTGQIPRLGDNSLTIRNKRLRMRQHEVLAASDCWRIIEMDDFNKCLDEYIGRRRAERLQIPYSEAMLHEEDSYDPSSY